MRVREIEIVAEHSVDPDNQLVLRQEFSHSSRQLRAALLLTCGALLASPFGILLATEGAMAVLMRFASVNPLAVVQLGMVGLLAFVAICFGIAALFSPPVRRRIVAIDAENAIVEDTVRGQAQHWDEPIGSYRGIRHKVITTSEGAVHTLILEHAKPKRSLHLAFAPNIAPQAITDAAERYQLPILSPLDDPSITGLATKAAMWLAGRTGLGSRGGHIASI